LIDEPPGWPNEDWDGVFEGDVQVIESPRPDTERLQEQVWKLMGQVSIPEDLDSEVEDRIHVAMAPTVVREVNRNPDLLKLEGTDADLTVFFSDVCGFSSIAEQLTGDELVSLLSEYNNEIAEIILHYEGTLDKYEGDMTLAFWGAPVPISDHGVRGCLAALDMEAKLAELGAKWREEGKPELSVRYGLNTGSAVVGNLGSRQHMDYTVMGHHVNLAARLQQVTRVYETHILISEHTYAAARGAIEVREVDTVRAVGHPDPVAIYEVLARRGELGAEKARVVEIYAQGLEQYRKRNWAAALGTLDKGLELDPQDGPTLKLKARCETFLADPPEWLKEDWDGAFTL
jgi:adenylate cyclase